MQIWSSNAPESGPYATLVLYRVDGELPHPAIPELILCSAPGSQSDSLLGTEGISRESLVRARVSVCDSPPPPLSQHGQRCRWGEMGKVLAC